MREMGWSWREYQDTSLYVRRVQWDCIVARRTAENDRAQGRIEPEAGPARVRRTVRR